MPATQRPTSHFSSPREGVSKQFTTTGKGGAFSVRGTAGEASDSRASDSLFTARAPERLFWHAPEAGKWRALSACRANRATCSDMANGRRAVVIDANGNRIRITRPDGVRFTSAYAAANRMVDIFENDPVRE